MPAATALAAALALVVPTPYDLAVADGLLHQPRGTPPAVEPTPRLRAALLAALLRAGAIDPGDEPYWFGPGDPFARHLDFARAGLRAVRDCPALDEGAWLPDDWACCRVTEALMRQARLLRERAAWEPDRAGGYERAAGECDALCAVWFAMWRAAPGYRRDLGVPRRVALRAVREALGPLWDARRWPDQAVWGVLAPR